VVAAWRVLPLTSGVVYGCVVAAAVGTGCTVVAAVVAASGGREVVHKRDTPMTAVDVSKQGGPCGSASGDRVHVTVTSPRAS
jgi:hypothetical protein